MTTHRSGSPSVAVVVPMFNERAGAAACVQSICRALQHLPGRTTLIVVDDGSVDGTPDVLARLATTHSALEQVSHVRNRGYGAALQSGVDVAIRRGYDYVLFMDSDLTNSP